MLTLTQYFGFQMAYLSIILLSTSGYGRACVFAGATMLLFSNKEFTTLDKPLTEDEASWLGKKILIHVFYTLTFVVTS